MSSILVTDILQKLKEDNKRLLNELLYAKQCLKVLIEFKIDFDFYSNKFKQSLELNEWKKFEKFDENISEIVSKMPINREKTNNNNMSEEYVDIKTEMPFNVNINDNSNDGLNECNYDLTEEQMQRRVETNRRLKEMFVERNDNYLKDIIRQTNEDINEYHSVENNIEEETDIEDFTEDMSVLKRRLNEYLEENNESVDSPSNSRFGDSLNEHLWQTSDGLLSNDITVTTDTKQPILSFKCDICDRSYSTKWNLGIHKREEHKINYQDKDSDNNKFKFSYQSNAKKEKRKIYYKCNLCDCQYINIYDLTEHKNSKHNVKAMSRLSGHRVSHEMRAEPKKSLMYSCEWPGCDYKANTQKTVEKHKVCVHLPDSISRRFACTHPECDKKFKAKKHLISHLETHSTERVKCEICGKDFKTEPSLMYHIKSQHSKGKIFVCDHNDCEFEANTVSKLNYHKEKAHTIPTIVCAFEGCDKLFTNIHFMKEHMQSHNTELTHKCPIDGCDKAFKYKTRVKVHLREKHTDETYSCDWPGCDYITKSKASFKGHSDVHKTERDFICEWPECGKGFKNREQLKLHIRRHTNDKRYVCSYTGCQYSTTDSPNLIKHKKQVHEKTIIKLK